MVFFIFLYLFVKTKFLGTYKLYKKTKEDVMSLKEYFVEKQRMLERRKRLDTTKKVATGLAIGSVIGSAVGVLFAPKSGKETRKALVNKADELKIGRAHV